ncbi:MAG: pyridoxal phosphate-dependent aminotransferase [Deltaproteobacteria bacterium]|nr:pyridoxal phosphate-dependent aminotransferase [Deltaproteobacteria bacterium]MBW2360068.1 pyridoxal phosphate-dependent aminotransferase [Deltaproteobacteria bacterium]
MPRPPACAPTIAAIPGAVFSPIQRQLEAGAGQIVPLHVGDSWREPFVGGRMQDLSVAEHPGMHRYSETNGHAPLVDAIIEKVRSRNALPCERDQVLVSAGATGGLGAIIGMLAAPDEEVLILAPFWPLIRGIVQTFRAVPVEVPFYDRVTSAQEAVEAVRSRITSRTVALYVSTPSNPTGRVLPEAWLAALAELARREDLWLVSDEVYEETLYRGEHFSIARAAPERSLTAFSFSKAYGMAGNRTGYVVGPAAAVAAARKVSTHTFYAAPTAGQLAALAALRDGAAWLAETCEAYRRAGEATAAVLGVPPPEGGTFLFLDVAAHLDERGLWGFLGDCLEDGVALAPGPSCGAGYDHWVRLCFTSAPPEDVARAAKRLAGRLGR